MDFCTYITFYRGNKMPPFYIGYTSVKNITQNGYHGSVGSKRYSKIWKSEIRNNKHLFKTVILTTHKTRDEAIKKEIYFQEFFSVHKNPMYINAGIHNERFYVTGPMSKETREKISIGNKGKKRTAETKRKMSESRIGTNLKNEIKIKISKTKNSKEWKETTGYRVAKRSSEIQNDPEWKETVGKSKKLKEMATKNNPEWKETVGKSKKLKEMATKNDPEWKETVGKKAAESCSKTKNSVEWKETIGKQFSKKISEIQRDDAWKAKHFKDCEHCGMINISPGNYKRWHGENCKQIDRG